MKHIALVVVFVAISSSLAGRPGCNLPLSTTDKSFEFSASSSASDKEPWRAQRQAPKAWCSKGQVKFREYLQINLSSVRHISALETLGHKSSFREFYVKSFLLGYSLDGKKWKFYKSRSRTKSNMFWTKLLHNHFIGNTDTSSSKWNYLHSSFIAKHIRVYPLTFRNGMCMKVELYGCNKTLDCTHVIKLKENEKVNITSPFYPQPYPTATHCNWLISLPSPETLVSLIAMDFDVGHNCSTGYVKVYNHLYSFSKHLAGTYCNSAKNMMPRVMEKNNQFLRISFDGGNNTFQHRGFSLMVLASNKDIKTAKQCENSTISLDCRGHEQNIEILDVFYGQYQYSNVCTVNENHSNSSLFRASCRVPNVLPKLQETCNYRNVCQVAVDQNTYSHGCSAKGEAAMEMFLVYHCNATEQIISHSLPTSTSFLSSIKNSTRSPSVITSQRTNEIVSIILPTSTYSLFPIKNISRSSPVITSQQTNAVVIPTTIPSTVPPSTPPPTTSTLKTTPVILPEVTTKPHDPTENHQTVKIEKEEKSALDSTLIIIIAAVVGFFLIISVAVITICCVCCKKTRKEKEITKMGIVPSESNHSKVIIDNDSLYEKIEDVEREMGGMGRYEAEPNRYSPLHAAQHGMSENPLYQSGDPQKSVSSSYDAPARVRYIGASETSIKFPPSVPEPSYIDVLKSPEELPANSIPMAKYLEPPNSPPDQTVITISDGRYSSPVSSSLPGEEVYETMVGSVA